MADVPDFDEFYLGSRVQLLRQLAAMTGEPEMAQDVLQEAYARAWQRWSRVSGMDDPRAWVRTVAWRLAISQFRRRRVAERFLSGLRRTPAEGPGLEHAIDLEQALLRLNPEFRRALVLHDLCGFTVDQIATECGVASGTVKSRLSRGRAAVAASLGADYWERSPEVQEELS
jgi:RNA polymerase sigma-70 factor (ECF subfamily)